MVTATLRERFDSRWLGEPNSGCWLWMGASYVRGYGYMYMPPDFTKKKYAHRISYELHNGPIGEGLCVCHKCDTPACVNPAHLFLGTHHENMLDMVAKDRNAYGARNSKLSEEQAIQIKRAAGSLSEIARQFGIGTVTVWHIKNRKTWKHLETI